MNAGEKTDFERQARGIFPEERLLFHAPMKEHTTFKIGGPADVLCLPKKVDEIVQMTRLAEKFALPLMVIGNGSNVLVRDKGIRGIVMKLSEPMGEIKVAGNILVAGAGALLKDVSERAAEAGLSGLEFACGIPGTVGGAVFMNAGAYDGEMKNVLTRVRSVTQEGTLCERAAEALQLGYRRSIFQTNGEFICEAELTLAEGDPVAICAKMAEYMERREMKQPLEMPSAGSTFKRPEGYYAGTLIDQTGLKGFSVGGAQVSEKHAGFVVNKGNATAQDVLDLIAEVQRRVYEKHGVHIYPEVRMVGEE